MDLQIKALANNEAELLIYGYIGGWDNDSSDLANQIKELKADTLRIRINSGGGSLLDGIAIYHAIRKFSGKKIVEIDALAASAASVIAMAGDERIMPQSTFMMIHNSSVYAGGNADELAKTAQVLEMLDGEMANLYVARTGQSFEKIKQMMNEETWLGAEKALELGFATSIVDDVEIAASINDKGYLVNGIAFKNIPESIKQKVCTAKASVSVTEPTNEVNKQMDIQALMQQHPELYKQVQAQGFEQGKQEGIKAERERIQAIENIGLAGHEKLIAEAKFNSGISAEALSMQILAAEKQTRQNFVANSQADAAPLAQIGAGEPQAEGDLPANVMAAFATAANLRRTK